MHTCSDAHTPQHTRAAKTAYGTSLANVDWLHGAAESLLTVTNLFVGEPAAAGSGGDRDARDGGIGNGGTGFEGGGDCKYQPN